MKLAVLGAGAWGTALAIEYARSYPVTLWTRDAIQAAQMQQTRVNTRYLPDIDFPSALTVTDRLEYAIDGATLILLVTPIAGLRSTLQKLAALSVPLPPILWACKGFEAQTGLLPHAVFNQVLPEQTAYGALSGPSFAHEVAQGLPAAVAIASPGPDFAIWVTQALNSARLRLYANTDLIGVEVGGAVKNVMAIATGVADGLKAGMNARAALITRGLAEMTRLALVLGGKEETMRGLAGMGDLILTCTGSLSRNRQVGIKLAEGKPLPVILAELGHVAEGVSTAREVFRLSQQLQVSMPITEAVCGLLDGESDLTTLISGLMTRTPKMEFERIADL